MGGARSCEDIFGLLHPPPDNSACKQVTASFPDCMCERHSVRPQASPGIVGNDEIILRFVPNHQDYFDFTKGILTPKNFDWVATRGLSVNRNDFCGKDEILKQQVEGNYLGYVEVKVALVRALLHYPDAEVDQPPSNPVQVFAVYDTALETNPGHADICQAVFFENPPPGKKSRNIKFRRDLQMAFGNNLKSFVGHNLST